MKTIPFNRYSVLFLSAVAILAVVVAFASLNAHNPTPVAAAPTNSRGEKQSPVVRFTETGELIRPTGYRNWMYVGTPLTPNDMNDGKAAFPEFHNVYIDPSAYEAFEETGKFPDGTVMIKELVSVGSKQASSGKGYFMGEFTGLEVLIKDETRFKDEPGHWAFFSFGHEYPLKESARLQPVANCSTCHGNLADDEYVFTQYYPVLRAAKNMAATR